jgi:uncharacterized Fe-S radical SAM superfamily protein PflX
MRFLAEDISRTTYINSMDQYRPCWKTFNYPPLNRQITREEKLRKRLRGERQLDRTVFIMSDQAQRLPGLQGPAKP